MYPIYICCLIMHTSRWVTGEMRYMGNGGRGGNGVQGVWGTLDLYIIKEHTYINWVHKHS